MKKVFFLFILIVTLNSCLTVEKIQRNCDKFAQVCVTDSETVTVIEYRDTTVYLRDTITVTLPPDTVKISDTVTITDSGAQLPKVEKTFGIIGVSAEVYNSFLSVNAWLTDSTLLVPYADSVTVQNTNTTNTQKEYIQLPPERYIPKFYKFTFWWFFISLVAGFVVFKFGDIISRLRP